MWATTMLTDTFISCRVKIDNIYNLIVLLEEHNQLEKVIIAL